MLTYEEVLALVASLQKEVAALREENHRLREENQALRDEVARLVGHGSLMALDHARESGEHRRKKAGDAI